MSEARKLGILALCLVLAAAGCAKKDPYAEPKAVLNSYIAAMEAFGAAMDKVDGAPGAAAAMNALTAALKDIAPKIKALSRKFPELDDVSKIPADMKPFLTRFDEIHGRMIAAMQKAMQWGDDPAVQAAKEKFQEIQKLME